MLTRLRFEVENDYILREYSEREEKVGRVLSLSVTKYVC